MATTTTHYGFDNPASGDAQAASELAITATIDAVDAALWGVASGTTGGYYAPVTNGDVVTPEILFDAAGDVIVAWIAL